MATTPTSPQRSAAAAPDTTKPPSPARNPGHPSLTMTTHARTPQVTGPPAWENGRDAVSTPAGTPPLHSPGAQMRPHMDMQVTRTVGVNPDPPASRSQSDGDGDGD